MGLYATKLNAEVSALLRLEWTKYCPMSIVLDLLVTFIDAEHYFSCVLLRIINTENNWMAKSCWFPEGDYMYW